MPDDLRPGYFALEARGRGVVNRVVWCFLDMGGAVGDVVDVGKQGVGCEAG